MFSSCPGYLDDAGNETKRQRGSKRSLSFSLGVWNNGFSCQPINDRNRVCCGPDNRRECCFADEFPHRTDSSSDSDMTSLSLGSSSPGKHESTLAIASSSYALILAAIGITLVLLVVLLIVFVYIVRRKLNESSSSSSSTSCASSFDKPCHRLSVVVGSSSKSSTSSPVPSTYADYWSRTIVSPSEWTLTKPYNSFIGGAHLNNHSYFIDP